MEVYSAHTLSSYQAGSLSQRDIETARQTVYVHISSSVRRLSVCCGSTSGRREIAKEIAQIV